MDDDRIKLESELRIAQRLLADPANEIFRQRIESHIAALKRLIQDIENQAR